MPVFEIEIVNNEYLLVHLSIDEKGLYFEFDENNMPVYFDGIIKNEGDVYLLPFDDCFSLDEHLETVYSNISEGYMIPNNLHP